MRLAIYWNSGYPIDENISKVIRRLRQLKMRVVSMIDDPIFVQSKNFSEFKLEQAGATLIVAEPK